VNTLPVISHVNV